ncbi:MAG TPA: polysaccharide deacetylase, partial [Burkholderiales bacterium]|nr:polysaccharide deacetylase [Burkholderiales bacterium]
MLPRHARYDYSPIDERPDYDWPGGRRLAFCITTNIECFAFGKGRGHDNAKHGEPQTQRNYAWRDYGNRIGIWRLFDLGDELGMPLAHNTNSLLYDYAPQIFERIRRRGDEIVGHGRTNSENLHDFRWEQDEARVIQEVTDRFARQEGRKPKGWMGAGAYENAWTPDLLKEAGYLYVMDWPCDDQPIWLRTRSGPLLSVPYPVELNDSPQVIHRQHTGREFCDMLVDQFEEMVEQSERQPLVCNLSIHPYV